MASQEKLSEVADDLLARFSEEELATICRMVLTGKEAAIREIVDWAVPDIIYGPARSITECRHAGVIKSYNDDKGYGFITSDEIVQTFGKDIFLSSHQMGDFPIGTEVSFAVLLNKGKHQAFDLARLHEPRGSAARPGGKAYAGQSNIGTKGWFGDQGWPAAKGWAGHDGKGWGAGWGDGKGCLADGKGWDGGKGWPDFWHEGKGWYEGMGLGCDSCGKGKSVSGKTKYGYTPPKQRESKVGLEVPGITDTRFQGNVKSYGKKYGYGFIVSDELRDKFDKDIFVHAHELERVIKDLESSVGMEVIFSVVLNEENKPMAVDLELSESVRKRARLGGDELL